jgi:uncharacterized membrane protein YkvI
MLLFTIIVAVHSWQNGDLGSLTSMPPVHEKGHWVLSAITYVAFNLAMSQAVLVPLGAEVDDETAIRLGGWIGGLGLGAMLFASNFAMQLNLSEIAQMEIPMAYVINALGAGMKYFFLAVMWGEIFTTLIGNVYGLAVNLSRLVPYRLYTIMALIFILGYFFSLIGFPVLISYLYPFFGYCSIIVLVLLVFRRVPRL